MRTLAAMLMLAAVISAAEPPTPEVPKPQCSRGNAGHFWPQEANTDAALARRLSREGKLEICTRTTWSYRWLSPTVSVQDLGKRKTREAPGSVSADSSR